MKKIILLCGLVSGMISSFWVVFSDKFLDDSYPLGTRIFFGYATMVLSFSLIYVGVKRYRDNEMGGIINFGKALKISLLITIVASTLYVVLWMINFYFFIPDFSEKYIQSVRGQLLANGASQAEIKKQMVEINIYFQQYKNPLFNALTTYSEILPVGIVMSLITALILKSNPKSLPEKL